MAAWISWRVAGKAGAAGGWEEDDEAETLSAAMGTATARSGGSKGAPLALASAFCGAAPLEEGRKE
jgi:hypothetical protein